MQVGNVDFVDKRPVSVVGPNILSLLLNLFLFLLLGKQLLLLKGEVTLVIGIASKMPESIHEHVISAKLGQGFLEFLVVYHLLFDINGLLWLIHLCKTVHYVTVTPTLVLITCLVLLGHHLYDLLLWLCISHTFQDIGQVLRYLGRYLDSQFY